MIIRKFFAALIIFCSFYSSSFAQTGESVVRRVFTVGAWEGKVSYTASGNFSYCSMSSAYRSGITLIFLMFEPSSWRVAFFHPNWNLAKGKRYPVRYWLDGRQRISGFVEAVGPSFAYLELPPNSTLFQQFRKGLVFNVDFMGERFGFSLDGTAAALVQLAKCINNHYGQRVNTGNSYSNNEDNPFSTSPKRAEEPRREVEERRAPPQQREIRSNTASRKDEITAEDRLEATRIIANLLSQSEFRGYEILSSADIRKSQISLINTALVAWRAPNLIGAMHLFPKDHGDVDNLMAVALGGIAAECKGNFLSGKNATESPSERSVFALCRTGQSVTKANFVFVTRDDGAVFRFLTFTYFEEGSQDEERSAEEDRKLRNALKNNPI